MAANNKTQMVLNHDNSVEVSNDQQSPMTSTEQPVVKFVHPIIAWLCSKSLTGHVVLLRHTRNLSFESCFRKKLARIEHVLIVKVYFEKRKIAKVFTTHVQDFFRKSFSKASFERKLSSVSLPLVDSSFVSTEFHNRRHVRISVSYTHLTLPTILRV